MTKGILSLLFSLAFKTRYTLPLLISAGFMVLDYQLTIEVEVEGNARDQPQPEERMARTQGRVDANDPRTGGRVQQE